MNQINIVKHNAMKELLKDKSLTGIAKTVSEHDYFITRVQDLTQKNYVITIVDFEVAMTYDNAQYQEHSRALYSEYLSQKGINYNC